MPIRPRSSASDRIASALFLVLIFAGSACEKSQQQPVTVGAIMPLTGELATYGTPVKQGMEYAMEEINKAGGIKGSPLRIVFEDDRADPKTAVSAFNKLIDADKVHIILGPLTSGASMATAPVAERRKVVQLSTLAGTVELKYAGDYVFRLYPSSEYQAKYLADAAIDILGKKRAAILFINNAYGKASEQVVTKRYQERGGTITTTEAFAEGAVDFRTQLTKIKATKPELIFGLVYWKEGAEILKQAKALGLEIPVIGEDSWYGPVESIAGEATKLLAFANVAFGERYTKNEGMQRFITDFKTKYGKEADAYVATGYDAVKIAARAIQENGNNADGIKKALYATKDYVGALGKVSFDEYGDNVGGEFDLYMLDGGKAVRYSTASRQR